MEQLTAIVKKLLRPGVVPDDFKLRFNELYKKKG